MGVLKDAVRMRVLLVCGLIFERCVVVRRLGLGIVWCRKQRVGFKEKERDKQSQTARWVNQPASTGFKESDKQS